MDDKKTKYRREYYLKNKEKLINYGKNYYNQRIYPKVEIEVKHGDSKSTRQGKKMVPIFYEEAKKKVWTTHFGAVGYNDYTISGDLQAKMNYLQRHEK